MNDDQVLMLTFIDRFSAPDMMMRYHWGLGVGHYHAHQPTSISHHNITSRSNLEPDSEGTSYSNVDPLGNSNDDLEYISDDPELGLEDRHLPDEGWQDMDSDSDADGGGHSDSDFEDIEEEDYTGC
jgi:hypothetical protein